jgi:hypothetical protein
MRALTICQPYAELIARGEKRVENRSWYTRYRGPLLIHAGASREWLYTGFDNLPSIDAVAKATVFSAIVAVADVDDCLAYTVGKDGRWIPGFHDSRWLHDDPHACGPWCWVLKNVRRLREPIPASGRQSLWTPTADVVAAIERQLG